MVSDRSVSDPKISLQCINLTKSVCPTDVTFEFLKINGRIRLKLYSIVSFIQWIDFYLYTGQETRTRFFVIYKMFCISLQPRYCGYPGRER